MRTRIALGVGATIFVLNFGIYFKIKAVEANSLAGTIVGNVLVGIAVLATIAIAKARW